MTVALWSAAPVAIAATELAKINGTSISLEDFNKKYEENLKFFQYRAPAKKDVLDDLIKRELGVQEAKKLGLDKDPEVIERMNTVLYHALLDKKLGKDFDKINVSDKEAEDYYRKNPEVRTSHIFISLGQNPTPEEEKAAFDRIKKVQDEFIKTNQGSFAEAAQRFSESAAAPMGGDIDYQTKDKLDPAYYAAAVKLKSPGKVSDIIRTNQGFYIVKLTGIRPWVDADKGLVKRQMFDEKRAEVFDRYIASLKSSSKVSVNAALIK